MGESRHSLLQWINELCQVQYTKVEQCGTGAAYCHVIDSIFLDVPVHKCKMNAKQSYELMANYKILQNAFKDHSIDKPVPVERLMNCKMQDNLEFLQWLKKFWDMNYPGGEYDAVGRRGAQGASGPVAGVRSGSSAGGRSAGKSPVPTSAPVRTSSASTATTAPARRPPVGAVRSSGARASNTPSNDAALQALTTQMDEMKLSVEGLEKERDFYFNKLRDIEILIGARLETEDETMTETEKNLLLEMQQILYSTEEGFEVPEGEEEDAVDDQVPPEDELETF